MLHISNVAVWHLVFLCWVTLPHGMVIQASFPLHACLQDAFQNIFAFGTVLGFLGNWQQIAILALKVCVFGHMFHACWNFAKYLNYISNSLEIGIEQTTF